jgi:hypothetical protein
MLEPDDLRIFIPSYLTPEDQAQLLSEIRGFPSAVYTNFYLNPESNDAILQGDGLQDIDIYNLPDIYSRPGHSIVISNTCDLDPANERIFPTRIIYSPIISIAKYIQLLQNKGLSEERITTHLRDIRKQIITQIFFIPSGRGYPEDAIIFLDHLISIRNNRDTYNNLRNKRLFSLTNSSYYLFLTKLSIHMTRFNDGINRT